MDVFLDAIKCYAVTAGPQDTSIEIIAMFFGLDMPAINDRKQIIGARREWKILDPDHGSSRSWRWFLRQDGQDISTVKVNRFRCDDNLSHDLIVHADFD